MAGVLMKLKLEVRWRMDDGGRREMLRSKWEPRVTTEKVRVGYDISNR